MPFMGALVIFTSLVCQLSCWKFLPINYKHQLSVLEFRSGCIMCYITEFIKLRYNFKGKYIYYLSILMFGKGLSFHGRHQRYFRFLLVK